MRFRPGLHLHLQTMQLVGISSLAVLCLCPSWFFSGAYANESTSIHSDSTTDGFVPLSQGDHLTNWKHSGNWKIESGVIARQGKGGSLVPIGKKIPDDFELRFEWKVNEGGL